MVFVEAPSWWAAMRIAQSFGTVELAVQGWSAIARAVELLAFESRVARRVIVAAGGNYFAVVVEGNRR